MMYNAKTIISKDNRDIFQLSTTKKILQTLWSDYPTSRIELSKTLNLNKSTVTNLIKELDSIEMIVDVGRKDNRVGRTSNLIMLNRYWAICGCIIIRPRSIKIAISDFYANTIWERSMDIDWNSQPFALLQLTAEKLLEGLSECQHLSKNVLGIGVSMPSIIRRQTGEVYDHHSSLWHNIPVKEYLQQYFDAPVYIDSITNNALLAEYWFGGAKYYSHSILLNISYGIGCSIMIDGVINHGNNGFAGNAAHMIMDSNGPTCPCGQQGCWELSGSLLALGEKKLEDVLACAENRDGIAISQIDSIGRNIGLGIINLVNVLNPQCVIINGDVLNCGNRILDSCNAVLSTMLPPHLLESFHLRISRLGKQAILKGAFTSVIVPFFN